MQLVPITTNVMTSNFAHGEVYMYLIHHYVVKLVSDFRLSGRWFSPPIKTDCHDIAEILLKVALNTITLKITCKFYFSPLRHMVYERRIPD